MKAFVVQYALNFDIGPNHMQMGVVTFSSKVLPIFSLNKYSNQVSLIGAINNIGYYSGNTNTGQALEYVATNSFTPQAGGRAGAAKILVVMTDGQSTHPSQTIQAANKIHQMNIKVFAIGIGSGVDKAELNAIASDSQHVFQVQGFNGLSTLETDLRNYTCSGMYVYILRVHL